MIFAALLSCCVAYGQNDNGLHPYKLYGYKDASGNVIITAQYDDARSFSEGVAAVRVNDLWGFINEKGTMVIQPQFDNVGLFSDGLAAAEKEDKWGFIDKSGKWVIQPQFSQANDFSSGLAAAEKEEKWGFIDKSGKWVVQPQFDEATDFSGDIASVRVGDWSDGKWGCIDKKGKWIFQPQFENAIHFYGKPFATTFLNGKQVLINNKGKIIAEFEEEEYFYTEESKNGLYKIYIGENKGVFDENGWVFKPQHCYLSLYDGFFIVEKENDTIGIMSRDRKWLIEPTDNARILDNDTKIVAVLYEGQAGLLNKTGWIVKPKYEYLKNLSDGMVAFLENEKWGFLNTEGKQVVEPKYEDAGPFSEGMASVYADGKWGFIDKKGKMVIAPNYDYVGAFSEGMAAVEVDDKWGFIDKTGKMVIQPQFAEADHFSQGLAAVKNSADKWGYIDKTGKTVIEYKFDHAEAFNESGTAYVGIYDDDTYDYVPINKAGKFIY